MLVYSHDAFGLGNLRRKLAICEHLLSCWPGLSVLLVSGSPMLHEYRLTKGLDYIKLPCLNRGPSGALSAKYLGTSIDETVALRSQLIQSAAAHFKPHLLLIDKKPTGLQGELKATLHYLKTNLPHSKCVLLLRDILDTPKKTIKEWCQYGYYRTIQSAYDRILVVGMQSVFDLVQTYRLPLPVAYKVRYCGYIRKPTGLCNRVKVRSQLGLTPTDRLVLVTPGGGEDGYSLIHTYLTGLKSLQSSAVSTDCSSNSSLEGSANPSAISPTISPTISKGRFHSLILCGPEMPAEQCQGLQQLAADCTNVSFNSFTNELFGYLQASDIVVSMGGYNTLTEILTARKRAVVLPRVKPSQEQLIRSTRFAQKRWITLLSPKRATPTLLIETVLTQLSNPSLPPEGLDFNGLSQVYSHLRELVMHPQQPAIRRIPAVSPTWKSVLLA